MTLTAFLREPYTADDAEEQWRAYEPAKSEAEAKKTRRVTVTFMKDGVDVTDPDVVEAVRQQMDRFYRRAAITRLEEIAEVERTQVHGGRGSVAIVAPRWRRHRERTALARLLDHKKNTLDKRLDQADELRAVIDQGGVEADETERQQIEHVTPLGERGPPGDRVSSRNRGPGRPIHLLKSIVPTGLSGGDV